LFRDARLKIDRAYKHIREIEAAILSLHEAYVSSIEKDANTGGHSIKYECADLDSRIIEIALITGDAVHNLRTALDHAWFAIIDKLGLGQNSWTRFPFADTAQALGQTLKKKKIDIASPALFEKLTTKIKPYCGGDVYLWGLHKADITDKHKLIIPIMEYTGANGIRLEDEHGVIHDADLMPRPGSSGVMYLDLFSNIKIKEKGHVSLSIHFHEGPLVGFSIPQELQYLALLTSQVVESLETLVL
jgi:hypothetical protein